MLVIAPAGRALLVACVHAVMSLAPNQILHPARVAPEGVALGAPPQRPRAAAAATRGDASPAVAAAAAGATPAPPQPAALDALLHFTAGAELERGYAQYIAGTLRPARAAALAFFCAAFGVYALVGAGRGGAAALDAGYAVLMLKWIVFLVLAIAVHAGPARVGNAAAAVAALTNIFAVVVDVRALAGGNMAALSNIIVTSIFCICICICIFCAMPLVNGVALSPHWRVYAAACVAHAARAVVELAPLGAVPTLLGALAAIFGAVISYFNERHTREHFVSRANTRARRRTMCYVCVCLCVCVLCVVVSSVFVLCMRLNACECACAFKNDTLLHV